MSEPSFKNVKYIVQARPKLIVEKIGLDIKRDWAVDVMKWWLFFSTDVIGQ
jgi:hypothetical protein